MKNWMVKKAVSILLVLSITVAMGMNGTLAYAAGPAGAESGAAEYAAGGMFTVTMDGKTTPYNRAEDIVDVWEMVQGKTAEIHLLQDLNIREMHFKGEYNNADHYNEMFLESGNITFTMETGVELFSEGSGAVLDIKGGTFILGNGDICSKATTITGSTTQGYALIVHGGSVYIKGNSKISGYTGLNVSPEVDQPWPHVEISGGTFIGNEYAIQCSDGMKIADILANGYAFQKNKNNQSEWVDHTNQTNQTSLAGELGQCSYIAKQHPVKFEQHPVSTSITYDADLPPLSVEAVITDANAVSGAITYKWYQVMPDGTSQDTGVTTQAYTFQNPIQAGTYRYYCRATCDWFSLNSDTAVITVEKKTLVPHIEGEGDKEYDGTTKVLQDLSIRLEGVVRAEQVSGSAISWEYDSPEPGDRTIIASGITLTGADSSNYKLSSDSASMPGKITPLSVTGVSLDKTAQELLVGHVWQLTAKFQPENGTDQKVVWTSDNPAVATVDGNGRVTAVRAGRAVITATTVDGGYTATCTITVSSPSSAPDYNPGGTAVWKEPFIKGRPDRKGWNAIRTEAEIAAASPGSGTIAIDMNGTISVPGSFFMAIRGQDVDVTFDMGRGVAWTVRGKDVTSPISSVDFSVVAGKGVVPQELVQKTADGLANLELQFEHIWGGAFTATLALQIGSNAHGDGIAIGSSAVGGYAGMYANLFAYNQASRTLEFICAAQVGKDGTAQLPLGPSGEVVAQLPSAPSGEVIAQLPSIPSGEGSVTPPSIPSGEVVAQLPPGPICDCVLILSAYPMGGGNMPGQDGEEPPKQDGEEPENPPKQDGEEPENPSGPEEDDYLKVASVKLSKTVYTYNGKEKRPSVTAVDSDGRQISSEYYTVSYKRNRKVGKAKALVVFKGPYSGTVKKAFTIRPAGTVIQKATALRGSFMVKWKKQAVQTDGYQIQYSENSRWKGESVRYATVKKASKTKKTIKNVNAGKKYYVRIRTYKKMKEDGKQSKVYSKWSAKRQIKAKL